MDTPATFQCPKCAKRYPLKQGMVGKQAQCGVCGHVFPVTAAAPVQPITIGAEDVLPEPSPLAGPAAGSPLAPFAALDSPPRRPSGLAGGPLTEAEKKFLVYAGAVVLAGVSGLILSAFGAVARLGGTLRILSLVIGLGGAGMVFFALRQRMALAAPVTGGIALLLMVGAVLMPRPDAPGVGPGAAGGAGAAPAQPAPADPASDNPVTEPGPLGYQITIWNARRSGPPTRPTYTIECRLDNTDGWGGGGALWIVEDSTGQVEFNVHPLRKGEHRTLIGDVTDSDKPAVGGFKTWLAMRGMGFRMGPGQQISNVLRVGPEPQGPVAAAPPPPPPPPPPAEASSTPPAPPGQPAPIAQPSTTPTGPPVNLLASINPQRDQVRGEWKMEGGTLMVPNAQAATLVIPSTVPEEYTLTVVAERMMGNDSLNLGLIVGGRQTMLALEGWGMRASGLNMVNGRTADNNETTFTSAVFTPGTPSTIVCTVRKASVQVTCNGQQVVNWSGDPQQLSLDARFWTDIPAGKLFVGAWQTNFRISKLELVPLSK